MCVQMGLPSIIPHNQLPIMGLQRGPCGHQLTEVWLGNDVCKSRDGMTKQACRGREWSGEE